MLPATSGLGLYRTLCAIAGIGKTLVLDRAAAPVTNLRRLIRRVMAFSAGFSAVSGRIVGLYKPARKHRGRLPDIQSHKVARQTARSQPPLPTGARRSRQMRAASAS